MSTPLNVAEELLGPNVNHRSGRTALWYENTSVTWQELAGQVNRVGHFLKDAGFRAREMVVLQLPDGPLCVSAFLGAIKAGIWPIMVSPDLGKTTLEYILRDSQAVALITRSDYQGAQARSEFLRQVHLADEESFQKNLAAMSDSLAPYPSQADDIAFLLYTSGSTGNPKGVPHRHRDMLACADSFGKEVLHTTDQDVHFSVSKLFFAFGLGNSLFLPFRFGAASILFPGKPSPQDILHILATRRPTVFFSVPSFYSMLIKSWGEGFRVDSLRLCVSAGEALPATIYQEWRRRTGIEMIDGIGTTEALHLFISNRPGQVWPGSSGILIPGYEARIIGEDGCPALGGQPGSLYIRGPSTAPYYWNLPEETARTMSPEGWVRTGDIYTEEGGCFTYQGRADDLFKVDAHWVAPIQVEAVLREHPAVRDCAVTGRKLESLVKPQAHVVLNTGFIPGLDLEKELRFHVLERLPDYMCPVQIHFCTELPRTETGKIQRFRLRESSLPSQPLAEPGAAVSGSPSVSFAAPGKKAPVTSVGIREVMKQAGILESIIARLQDEVPLLEQGFDSMDLPALAAAAEKWYRIDLSDADPTVLQTVNEFVAYLNRKLT